METLESALSHAVVDWLLEPANPSVRRRALTDLLGLPETHPEVTAAREAIGQDPDVIKLLAGQEATGNWGVPHRYFDKMVGTGWRWLLLHELGLDPQHPQMKAAAVFLLNTAATEAGGFASHLNANPVPCYNGWLLWGFIRSGLAADTRVRAALDWLSQHMWFADGDDTVSDPSNGCWGRHTCYRGVVPVVKALAALPGSARNASLDRVLEQGIAFILRHHVYKRSHDLTKVMNAKLTQLTFPTLYWPDLLEVMLILTSMGIHDDRMADVIVCLRKKQRRDGTWELQRTYNERSKHDVFEVAVPLGERLSPNKWVTLRALTVLRRWNEKT